MSTRRTEPRRLHRIRLVLAAIPALLCVVPFAGAISNTRIFHVRDLAFQFWPLHSWLRNVIHSGESPFWDPFPGNGAPTAIDPIRQILFLPALPVRLLLPDALGFNLWVALPFPVGAIGLFLLLRRRLGSRAAAVGASIFAASGPLLSTGNVPNHSWALAALPWVLWATDRVVVRSTLERVAVLAALSACQLTAGEPVTYAATTVLSIVYAAWNARSAALARVGAAVLVGGGIAVGVLLAAVYALPLVDAARLSYRGVDANTAVTNVWSLHPISWLELVMPLLFGDVINGGARSSPWLLALNDGREPYLHSLYVGFAAFPLAFLGLLSRRRYSGLWVLVVFGAVVFALGRYTPIYPFIQDAVPILRSFRTPAKYLPIALLGLSALAAIGWQSLIRSARGTRLATAGAAVVSIAALVTLVSVSLDVVGPAASALADLLGIENKTRALAILDSNALSALGRLCATAAGSAILVAVAASQHKLATRAPALLALLAVLDPLSANSGLNPTLDLALLERPRWINNLADPSSRLYQASNFQFDLESESDWSITAGRGASEFGAAASESIAAAALLTAPSQYGIRESLSGDLPGIRPREYTLMGRACAKASAADRWRLLSRIGVKYFVASRPGADCVEIASVPPFRPLFLYECSPLPRAYVAASHRIEADTKLVYELLKSPDHDPEREVLLAEAPPNPSGTPNAAVTDQAVITLDGGSRVVVEASSSGTGSFLVLSDSYDRDWRATVDGSPARVLQANAAFRAVRLAPGNHTVVFEHFPRSVVIGGIVSFATASIGVIVIFLARRRRSRR